MERRIAVLGLGYVGLPVALAFAREFPGTIGFDINERRVKELAGGHDRTNETTDDELSSSTITFTANPEDLRAADFYVVAVPTPIDHNRKPDLRACIGASELVGKVVGKGDIVVYESTVYPGVTEDVCAPAIERVSGLKSGVDFKLGYSPERINPGDREHTLERITKIVSGQDADTLEIVAAVYGKIIKAGVHRAPSIKAAEAAKVIENTQRDLNIALMNELAIIFDRLGIETRDVLAAARTKWNFVPFRPGLVGGHCIGVDPYYLTWKAEETGYHPEVILAGRRINDSMGAYVANRLIKMLRSSPTPLSQMRVGIFGLTFKENVGDLRNSRVPDIVRELQEFGILPFVHDPLADRHEATEEYGLELCDLDQLTNLDAAVLAVPHRAYLQQLEGNWGAIVKSGGALIDVAAALDRSAVPAGVSYWAL